MSLQVLFRNKAIKSPLSINVNQAALATPAVAAVRINTTPYSPVTPATPIITANCASPVFKLPPSPASFVPVPPIMNAQDSLEITLKKHGYQASKERVKTLQGSILEVIKDETTYIVKATEKELHNKSVTYVDGKCVRIYEDILKETSILKYLTSLQPPSAMIKYIADFSDDFHFFLVMEFGGDSLFNFVKKSHSYIATKVIDIAEWQMCCKYAMNQMVDVLDWMHNKMGCCHLDVSLENFTIKHAQNIMIMDLSKGRKCVNKITFSHAFEVKLIDFGLAEIFRSKKENGEIDFDCNKFVGKTVYKAPRVNAKKQVFDARSADCWSLGVCFFMMFFGHPPWKKATKKDELYRLMRDGYILNVLSAWDLLDYATAEILNLLMSIFRSQKYRLSIREIKQHCFFTSTQCTQCNKRMHCHIA